MDDICQLLCTGDLHLGRKPSRIPAELDDSRFAPETIWQSIVQEAIDRNVDAVVLTGDVVDEENKYFEAVGPFERGALELDEHNIPLVVVAGNHDFDVFPRITRELDSTGLQCLGTGGTWETWTLDRGGDPLVQFTGWSFPSDQQYESPINSFDELLEESLNESLDESNGPVDDDVPTVGLLHADLGVPDSTYAPVTNDDLQRTPVDAWLLGHIHKPQIRSETDPFIIYPGSPQPLDPGEPGAHGPWIIEFDPTGTITHEQLPLASLRYEETAVDVSEATDAKDVRPLVEAHMSDHVQDSIDTGHLDLVLARLRLMGRTDAHRDIVDTRSTIESDLSLQVGAVDVRIERLLVDTGPLVDLEGRAEGDSPDSYLATLLLALQDKTPEEGRIEEGTADEETRGEETTGESEITFEAVEASEAFEDDYRAVLEDALAAMERAYEAGAYKHLRGESRVDPPTESDAIRLVERQARLLLDALIDQQGAQP